MTTNRMGLEQALSDERLEMFIRQPIDNGLTRGEQMELVREALSRRKASKEPVAYADPIALQGFSNFRKHPGSDIIIRGREWMWAKADSGLLPLYAAPPLQAGKVPDEVTFEQAMLEVHGLSPAEAFQKAWNKLRGEMLKSVTNDP